MKVDVIIPVHNPGPYLREALNSCMAQTYKNFNVIVVDDGSTEDFEPLVRKYRKTLYVRLDKNRGPAAARNYGARFGNGELISFLDHDDIWEPHKLDMSVAEFKRDPEIGMTCGNYRRLVDRAKLCHPFYRHPLNITWDSLMRQNYVASGSVTMRRYVFEELNGFDEDLWIGEDYKLWLRCSERYKIKYIHRVLYQYSVVKDGNSLTNRAELQAKHRGSLDIVKEESLERMNAAKVGNIETDID